MNQQTINNIPVDSLLAYFRVKPRSMKWDAILAYDRKDTNTVLLQEYILRHNTESQMPPITFEVKDNDTPTYKAYIFQYRFDTPRLSFANASISSSVAKLTSKVIGGTHVTFEMPTGAQGWDVVKLGSHSPLVQTNLEMEIDLTLATGEITGEGRVVLDISKGRNYRLNYNDKEHMRTAEGAEFQKAFARFPAEITEWELNRLELNPDNYLQPKEFFIRTHQPESARVKGAANSGEGAILVFTTMRGGVNGNIPIIDADMPYIIPDGHSATLVLGHQFLMNKIIAEGCKGIINTGDDYKIELEGPAEGFVQKLTVKEGARRRPGSGAEALPDIKSFELSELILGLGKTFVDTYPGVSEFFLDFQTNKLKLTWSGKKEQPVKISTEKENYTDNIGTQWEMSKELTFSLDDTGTLRMVVSQTGNEQMTRVTPENYVGYEDVSAYFEQIAGTVQQKLVAELNESMTTFLKKSEEIDLFRLNSLLFRGENAVKLERAEFPGDLVTFGKVGPTQTAFTIDHDLPESVPDRLEPMIGLGQTLKFVTVPPVAATWSVENIDGNTGVTGTIDPVTGVYVAPTAGQFEGRFLRVRVNATQGEYKRSALVSILVFDMDFSPQIQIIGAGNTSGRELTAGALGGETLTWSVSPETQARGGRVDPSEEDGRDHTFRVGPAIEGEYFTVDEVIVTTQSGRTQSSYLLVAHQPKVTLVVGIKENSGLPENKLQMIVFGKDGPVEPGDLDLTWGVPIGAGTIDSKSGVLTIDSAAALPFIVVTVVYETLFIDMTGFKLLPIPLFSVPETLRMLRK